MTVKKPWIYQHGDKPRPVPDDLKCPGCNQCLRRSHNGWECYDEYCLVSKAFTPTEKNP